MEEYADFSKKLLKAVGGPPNIKSCAKCPTQLKLEVIDPDKVDISALKGLNILSSMLKDQLLFIRVGRTELYPVYNALINQLKKEGWLEEKKTFRHLFFKNV